MSTYDVGDTIRLPFTAKDPAGVATDAAGISVAVTDPSGATTTPAVVHDGVGLYHADYGPAVLPGRFRLRWIPPNGSNVGAMTDIFHVLDTDPRFLLSLDDARKQLRKPTGDTVDDEDLRLYLAAVTAIVEDVAGAQAQMTSSTVANGGQSTILLPERVTAVTSVTENGVLLTAGSDYTVDLEAGIVYRGTTIAPFAFVGGHQNVVVNWTAGAGDASNVRLAARIILRHLWKADQEGGGRPGVGGQGVPSDAAQTPSGYAIPRRAMQLLTPNDDDRMPGFA
jgi:hypothetical protein